MPQDLRQRIEKEGKRVFLLFGEEPFLTEEEIQSARELLLPDFASLNITVTDEKNLRVGKLTETLESIPFMDSLRLVIVRSDLFRSGEKGIKKSEEEQLIRYLEHPAPSAVLIFAPPEVDKRSSLYRYLKKHHTIIESKRLDRTALRKWCIQTSREIGFELSGELAEFLMERSGYLYKDSLRDLQFLYQELSKLSSLGREKRVLERSDIEGLFAEETDSDVFRFVDLVIQKEAAKAMRMYRDMTGRGESPLMMLAMLSRQFALIGRCHLLMKKGYSSTMIAQKLDIHPYAAKKSVESCKRMTYQKAVAMLKLCVDTEFRIKTGGIREGIGIEGIIMKAMLS